MTVRELRAVLKGLPADMEVMTCNVSDGMYSKQGVHTYDHVVKPAKFKKVRMTTYTSDGFGGTIEHPNSECWKEVSKQKTEKRKGLFLDLPSYDH